MNGQRERDRIGGVFSVLGVHRRLTWEFTKRDVLGRYKGANFGLFWSLLSPFLMLVVYTLAFGAILQSRWPGYSAGGNEFALILYLGLIVHGHIAECLARAPGLMVQNANLVTKVVFPLQVLPWAVSLSGLFHMCANMLVFVLLSFLIRGHVPATTLLLPMIWVPFVVLNAGVCLVLSALGVYLRDISQVMGAVTTALLFLSSAIIPVQAVPEAYRALLYLNPLTFIIDQSRDVAYVGRWPNWSGLGAYSLVAIAVLLLGYAFFMKVRKGFADVL